MKKILLMLMFTATLFLQTSCKKYLTVAPEGVVAEENTFQNKADAITAINGLYGLMPTLVDQIFMAGEVRADLVVADRGADRWVREFADNRISASNPYCDYTKFYRLVIACNRTLVGLDQILKTDPVNYNRNVYLTNKAEVYYIRAWTYLQLVKIWGDVPYITSSVTKAEEISSFPVVKGETIIKNILKDAEDNFAVLQTVSASFLGNSDAFILTIGQWRDINSCTFLSELYLYDQNYQKALETLSLIWPSVNNNALNELGMFSGQFTQWHIAFDRTNIGAYKNQVVMALNFDATKGQTNNLMQWTNNKFGGSYAIRPSTLAINNWRRSPMSLQQYQTGPQGYYINEVGNYGANMTDGKEVLDANGYPIIGGYGDNYRAERGSYMVDGKDTLISKYLMKSRGVFKNPVVNDRYGDNDAFFNLYRDGAIWLMGCEITNNTGASNQALIWINGGQFYAYVYKSTRYRVGVAPLKFNSASGLSAKAQVERFLLTENALETAFEGRRWFDLVRFAKRNNDPAMLADMVAAKYPASQQTAVKERLMDVKNWYLPVYKK